MVVKVTREQYQFLQRVGNGFKPGGVATKAVVEANKATRVKLADLVVSQARVAASKKALEASVADEARKKRAAQMRKTERARLKKEKELKNNEKNFRNSLKTLASKVARVVNKVGDDITAKRKRREDLEKIFTASQAQLEKYRKAGELQKRAVVRVTDVTKLYRPR